jgi:hypothetical protein
MKAPLKHKCPVKGCDQPVHISRLMCPPHWAVVPAVLRTLVYQEYKKRPLSLEHLAACDRAIKCVNDAEKPS